MNTITKKEYCLNSTRFASSYHFRLSNLIKTCNINYYCLYNGLLPRQVRRTMKMTIILIMVTLMNVYSNGYSQKVTLSGEKVPIESFFSTIKEQTGYVFFYDLDLLKTAKPVTLKVVNVELPDALTLLFKNQPLDYRIENKTIVIGQKIVSLGIKGRVVDAEGESLPGVSILVKGTPIGTVTDKQGNYSLNAPNDGILVFSFMGFVTQEVAVGNRVSIDVTMVSDQKDLDEVVVIGYGTMRREDLTGSIANVKGDVIAQAGTFSAAQAIQGKMAGVQVTNNGDAGSESKIRIRGVNTIGNNDPLVVVDGITTGTSLQDINPADIESIDVLKDASALAIFGSRASNGVILVKTKKGVYGKKTDVIFDASYGVSSIPKRVEMVSAAQLVDIIDEARKTENQVLGGKYKLYDEIFPNDNWARQDLTNWQDELFKLGKTKNYAFGLNGGSDNTIYSFGVSYRDQGGVIVGNYANRLTFNSSIETKLINDKLRIGATINYSLDEKRGIGQGTIGGSAIFRALQTPSSTPRFLENGAPYQETNPTKIAYIFPGDNLTNRVLLANDYFNPNNKLLNSIYAELEIVKGLKFKSLLGQTFSQNFLRSYNSKSLNPIGDDATLNVNSGRSYAYSWDNTLTYDNNFGEHKLNIMAGTNMYESKYNYFQSFRQRFPEGDPLGLRYLDFGDAATQTNSENANNTRLSSYFGRVNYSYAGKYLFTATLRRDGSSRFYKDVRWGTFPSFSLGWNLAEEDFMKSVNWLNVLKIRTSWGQVGNQDTRNSYAYISNVASGVIAPAQDGRTDYIFGESQDRAKGKAIIMRGNERLTWEVTNMTNIGIDMTAGKISSTLEYFNNQTKDILLDAQFPDAAGYTYGADARTPKVNAGRVDTKGLEFSINYRNNKGDFNYNIGLNSTFLNNRIVSLGDREFIAGANTQSYHNLTTIMSRSYVGDAIGSFYGWQVDGMFNSVEEVNKANQNARDKALVNNPNMSKKELEGIFFVSPGTGPGDFKFKDNNGDGIITDEDRVYLGNGNPKYIFGFNFSSNYKRFDVALNINAVSGVNIHASYEPALSFTGGYNSLSSIVDHWTIDKPTQNSPRYTMSDPNNNARPSNRWIYDGSFVRVQNFVAGYSLPELLLEKVRLKKMRIYMNIQNLLTFSRYPFFDPEVKGTNVDGGNYDVNAGLDVGNSPQPRTFIFGLNLGF